MAILVISNGLQGRRYFRRRSFLLTKRTDTYGSSFDFQKMAYWGCRQQV
nr:MAG TPA: hypothetical protein [Caudoviricetes sp.]